MNTSVALRSQFGNRVKTALKSQELSIEELAARAGLSVARIKRILSGNLIRITLRDMSIIAEVVGTPLVDLLFTGDPVV